VTSPPRLLSVGCAAPKHVLPQPEARAFAANFFGADFAELDRLLPVFDNATIARRYIARPLEWYRTPHGFAEKNAVYRETALELAAEASATALQRADLDLGAFGSVVFVSTTGVSTPSLDSLLIPRLGLPRSVARVPLWGLGCAGGAAGLARAADLVRGTGKAVLLVAVEVCSTTFMHGDRSKANLVATALFGDGAAAAVIAPGERGLALLGSHSELLDDTQDVMGWSLEAEGLRVRFARSIPGIVREIAVRFVGELAAKHGFERSALEHYLVHPGGAKVLEAYARALALDPQALALPAEILGEYGNMSSVTVLFVLERFMARVAPRNTLGAVLGLGPGFCAEGTLVRW